MTVSVLVLLFIIFAGKWGNDYQKKQAALEEDKVSGNLKPPKPVEEQDKPWVLDMEDDL